MVLEAKDRNIGSTATRGEGGQVRAGRARVPATRRRLEPGEVRGGGAQRDQASPKGFSQLHVNLISKSNMIKTAGRHQAPIINRSSHGQAPCSEPRAWPPATRGSGPPHCSLPRLHPCTGHHALPAESACLRSPCPHPCSLPLGAGGTPTLLMRFTQELPPAPTSAAPTSPTEGRQAPPSNQQPFQPPVCLPSTPWKRRPLCLMLCSLLPTCTCCRTQAISPLLAPHLRPSFLRPSSPRSPAERDRERTKPSWRRCRREGIIAARI